jgi:hypothetical protein
MGEEVSVSISRPFGRASLIGAAFTFAAALSLSLHAQTMGTPERYSANAINMDRGAAGTIDLVVNRWSTDKGSRPSDVGVDEQGS